MVKMACRAFAPAKERTGSIDTSQLAIDLMLVRVPSCHLLEPFSPAVIATMLFSPSKAPDFGLIATERPSWPGMKASVDVFDWGMLSVLFVVDDST